MSSITRLTGKLGTRVLAATWFRPEKIIVTVQTLLTWRNDYHEYSDHEVRSTYVWRDATSVDLSMISAGEITTDKETDCV